MKSIKLIALAAALAVCCAASAQTYRTASISYAKFNTTMSGTTLGINLPGAAFGVSFANKLPVNAPVLYEIGANIMYMSGTVTFFDSTKTNLASVMVPLNLMLELNLDKLKVLPFVGLNATGHIVGTFKYEDNETVNWFDDSDGDVAKRFQLGAQVGVKAIYDKYMLGVSYNPYLTKLWDYSSSNLLLISLGILF